MPPEASLMGSAQQHRTIEMFFRQRETIWLRIKARHFIGDQKCMHGALVVGPIQFHYAVNLRRVRRASPGQRIAELIDRVPFLQNRN
jgi:hypothetical protein